MQHRIPKAFLKKMIGKESPYTLTTYFKKLDQIAKKYCSLELQSVTLFTVFVN